MNKLTKFWQSGLAAKFATVFVSLFAICCVCSSIVLVLPTPASSTMATDTAAVQKIPTSTTEGLELPSTPTVALLPPVTVESTVLFLPTVTLSPPVTIEASVTFIPTSSPVPTLPVKATAIVLPAPSNQPIRVHFIDVGQGDATLIQTSEGKNILVDGGDTNSGVIQYLQYAGVKSIDVIFATHPHADHIGGLVQVLKTYPVAKVVTNGEAHTTTTYERFLDAILAEKAEYIEAKRGDVIQVGTLSILVLNPAPGILFSDINENSLVLEFSNGPTTFLLMGDAGSETEAALLSSRLPLDADIIKVGHHGSTSGSSPAFLNAVSPQTAIYSAGVGNSYGHPAPQTIAALKQAGAEVYGTDVNGIVLVDLSTSKYDVEAQKTANVGAAVVATIPPVVAATAPVASGLEIVSITSPVSKGAFATLSAKTAPNASCSITVYYKSGPGTAAGLGPQTADGNGMVSWTWKVGTRTTSGTWRIVVNCNNLTKETNFTVK